NIEKLNKLFNEKKDIVFPNDFINFILNEILKIHFLRGEIVYKFLEIFIKKDIFPNNQTCDILIENSCNDLDLINFLIENKMNPEYKLSLFASTKMSLFP